MTPQKAKRLQDEIRTLLKMYGVSSAGFYFQHGDTMHVTEVTVTELNPFVEGITNSIRESLIQCYPDAPIVEQNTNQ